MHWFISIDQSYPDHVTIVNKIQCFIIESIYIHPQEQCVQLKDFE